jgi:ribosomal protein S28E/S33
MRQSVTQKHHMSCGIACVAFVTGVSYQELASGLLREKLERVGFYCAELVSILGRHGFRYRWKKISSQRVLGSIREGDIVFIARTHRYPGGHFLARVKGGWMDPWVNWPEVTELQHATSGFVTELPGRAEYLLYQ